MHVAASVPHSILLVQKSGLGVGRAWARPWLRRLGQTSHVQHRSGVAAVRTRSRDLAAVAAGHVEAFAAVAASLVEALAATRLLTLHRALGALALVFFQEGDVLQVLPVALLQVVAELGQPLGEQLPAADPRLQEAPRSLHRGSRLAEVGWKLRPWLQVPLEHPEGGLLQVLGEGLRQFFVGPPLIGA